MTDIKQNPLSPPQTDLVGQPQTWGELHGSSLALVISQLAQRQPVVVITPRPSSTQNLLEEIKFFSDNKLPLLYFPNWETLPYEPLSPHPDIISNRLSTLLQLPLLDKGVLVTCIPTLMHYLSSFDYVQGKHLQFQVGQKKSIAAIRHELEQKNYNCVSKVMEHGEFAVRASVVDFFPMGSQLPYRLNFDDEVIEKIRSFNPETQLSLQNLQTIQLLPSREFPLTAETIEYFRAQWRVHFQGDPTRCPIYTDVSKGFSPPGIEYYLPLFFDELSTVFDYLPKQSLIITLADTVSQGKKFWQEIEARYHSLRHDIERPILPPSQLFIPVETLLNGFEQYAHLHLQPAGEEKNCVHFATDTPPALTVDIRSQNPLAALKQFIDNFQGKILLTVESAGRREVLIELLQKHGVQPKVVDNWAAFLASTAMLNLTIAQLMQGLIIKGEPPLAIICENQLFGERVKQSRQSRKTNQRDAETLIQDLNELNIGDPVVHEAHGVGRYLGLMTLGLENFTSEFIQVEYAKQEKLYVPISHLHLISRFTGADPEHAPLHRLGSDQWEKAKRKAIKQVNDTAVELLDLYTRRAARQGYAFNKKDDDYQTFVAAFPFEETPDQQEAIAATLRDMYSQKPMDRLVCGDVGFGKTEVAMRAAFVAVQDNQQVAVLVPTTLLAQQHYQNFLDRFADWAVNIKQLSRFQTQKQQTETLKGLAEGQVDIVIGTHKLIQNTVKIKNLGLVIIDEEHRFGVRQKERLKSLRTEVDILTLTATPIPRSLSMAVADLRDLSIIATPPSHRLAVKTFVKEWDEPLIIEAITRELKRGGQVYFLHNDIDTIVNMTQKLRTLVPEASINMAHGKMRERELEQIMRDFYHRRFNVLVCTTIIETGIDIPTANTIIINRADKFGLAQLHQLRGRVGRSHHRAYAYLIVPSKKVMTVDANKRLEFLSEYEELGIGFTLATRDLEIRGAGELLGEQQSGHIQEIGYTLYTELLERAVQDLQAGKQPELEKPLHQTIEINFHQPALLPNDYLPDVHLRLIMYKRIANAKDGDELQALQVEMIDRFGLLPEPAKALFQIAQLRLQAEKLGILKIDMGEEEGYILFSEQTLVDPQKIVQLVAQHPQKYRLKEGDKLQLFYPMADFYKRQQMIEKLLQHFSDSSPVKM